MSCVTPITAAPSEALATHMARLPVHAPTWKRDFTRLADAVDAEQRAARGEQPLPFVSIVGEAR